MNTPQKYRKKPVVIEAMQWQPETAFSASDVIDWILANGGSAGFDCIDEHCRDTVESHVIGISTLEGRMRASIGDFVIRGVQGEFYPCKPDIFAETYEVES